MADGERSPSIPSNQREKIDESTSASDLVFGSEDFPCLTAPVSQIGINGGNKKNPNLMDFHAALQNQRGVQDNLSALFSKKKNNQDNPIVFQAPVQIEGKEVVSISSSVLHEKVKACEEMAIGYFVGRKLSYSMVRDAIPQVWKTKSEVSISLHSNSIYVFKFGNPEDRLLALDHGVFNIGSRLFVVRPWSPFIENKMAEVKSIPTWVLIYNVPLHLWNNLGLGPLASFVGKPLMMDDHTINQTRLSYARVLVEIDVNCKFPSFIPLWMDGKFVMNLPAEYEWKPQKCVTCCSFGHTSINCSLKNKKTHNEPHWTPKKKKSVEGVGANQTKEVFAENLEVSRLASEVVSHETANPIESVFENGAGIEEPFTACKTYSRKHKSSSKESSLSLTPICNRNPFSVLDPSVDCEKLLKNREEASRAAELLTPLGTIEADNIIEVVKTKQIQEVSREDAREEEESNHEETTEVFEESSEDENADGKVKTLAEVSQRKPMTKMENLEGLLKFSSALQLSRGGKEDEVKGILENIVDDFHRPKSVTQKNPKSLELARLGFTGEHSNDLGRGKRASVKKKK